jgi:hypothetical protein
MNDRSVLGHLECNRVCSYTIRCAACTIPKSDKAKKATASEFFSVNFQCGSVSVFDVNDKAIPKREELEAISFWDQSSSQSLMIF